MVFVGVHFRPRKIYTIPNAVLGMKDGKVEGKGREGGQREEDVS